MIKDKYTKKEKCIIKDTVKKMRIEEEIKIAYEKPPEEEIDLNNNMETKKKPIISFLMCTYNDVSLLKNAIYSLLRQEKKEWELIVLDNSDKSNKPWNSWKK